MVGVNYLSRVVSLKKTGSSSPSSPELSIAPHHGRREQDFISLAPLHPEILSDLLLGSSRTCNHSCFEFVYAQALSCSSKFCFTTDVHTSALAVITLLSLPP